MSKSIKNMMLSRRILTMFSPIKNEKLKEIKQFISLEKPKENIASTSFKIKTIKMEPECVDFEQASKEILEKNMADLESQVEF